METYEYPLGNTFRASTPEHAAARVFGGNPDRYLATRHTGTVPQTHNGVTSFPRWLEVTSADGTEWLGDIPIV